MVITVTSEFAKALHEVSCIEDELKMALDDLNDRCNGDDIGWGPQSELGALIGQAFDQHRRLQKLWQVHLSPIVIAAEDNGIEV
jgi:hypothetical protein